jgi:hypothetical protein
VPLFACGASAGTARGAATAPVDTTADTPVRSWAASLRWENDAYGDSDSSYTNGIGIALAHTGPSWADVPFDWLPWGGGRRTVTYALSQAMFTPEDTDRVTPDPKDRPYAGTLTFGIGLHADQPNRYDGLRLLVGVAGPWAGAGETQRRFHRIIGNAVPQGWDSQLHNEPILNLAYEHRRRYRLLGAAEGWGVEVIPVAGAQLGNLLTQGHLGGHIRLGHKIPQDFGTTFLRGMSELPPPRRSLSDDTSAWEALGFYLHAGIGANLVLHDLTLDGNTFKDSASVDSKLLVPMAGGGVGIGNRRFLATFSYVFVGKEFRGQQKAAEFGALTVHYFF